MRRSRAKIWPWVLSESNCLYVGKKGLGIPWKYKLKGSAGLVAGPDMAKLGLRSRSFL